VVAALLGITAGAVAERLLERPSPSSAARR
jgi:hypothetical protein